LNRRLTLLTLAAALVLAAPAHASGTDSAERALARAEALFSGDAAATSQSAATGTQGSRDATAIMRDLAIAVPRLEGDSRRRAIELLERPDEGTDPDSFGKEAAASPICDAHFCIHWADKGPAAPSDADSPANGIPDYVDSVAEAAATSYAVENDSLGWRDAKSDGTMGARKGRGEEGQVDVYVTDLGRGLFGYATTDFFERGSSRAGYLVIDNDYKGFGAPPIDLMRVTIAHEYNHILQFAYDTFQDLWMFESTATYMEDEVYPDIDDYLNFLPSFANGSTKPLATTDNRDLKVYGSAVWNHWLARRYGDDVIRDAWAGSTATDPPHFAVAAYSAALEAAGAPSFAEEFTAFAATTAEWNSSPAFPDSARYPQMRRRGKLGKSTRRFELDHTAYRLLNVPRGGSGTMRLRVKVEGGVRSGIALVGRTGPVDSGSVNVVSEFSQRGGKLIVELPGFESYDRVTAVLINADGRPAGRGYRSDDARFKATLSRRG
jgi:hypothetical protein